MSFGIARWAKLVPSCQHLAKRTLMPNSRHSSQLSNSPAATPTESAVVCESVGPAVFCADLQGRFNSCNSGFVRVFGYTGPEVIGRDFSALFKGKENSELRKIILSTTLSEGDYCGELLAQPKSGANFAVEFSATLLRDASSTPTVIAVVVTRARKDNREPNTPRAQRAGIVSRKI